MKFSACKELVRRIRRALARESILAAGRTAPNPAVGAVVLARAAGREILLFSGGTEPPGGRHAEIVALDECRVAGATPFKMYVTLEPCSHTGRTPPCTDRIISETELERVVLYQTDDSLKKSGVEVLRSAGRRVRAVAGAAAFAPGKSFLAGFIQRTAGRGPRYHIKFALSADGFMAGPGPERLRISGPAARRFVMALRSRVDAVLVGPGTVAGDDPGLDLRLEGDVDVRGDDFDFGRAGRSGSGDRSDPWLESLLDFLPEIERGYGDQAFQPHRIFLLGRAFPGQDEFFTKQSRLAAGTGKEALYITTRPYASLWPARASITLPEQTTAEFAPALRAFLGERGFNEVLIEGGPTLLERIAGDFRSTDRGYILRSRGVRAGGGRRGPNIFPGEPVRTIDLGADVLESYDYSASRIPG